MKHHLNLIKKLSSRKGMSMTFGLLLLLVALTVGSVVLTAGTAAAGRNIRSAEADARYYAVMSAAGFVRDMFDGKTVSLVRTKVETTTVTTEYEKDGTVVKNDPENIETVYDANFSGLGDGLTGKFGYALLVGNQGVPERNGGYGDGFLENLFLDTSNRAAAGKFTKIDEDTDTDGAAFSVVFETSDRTDDPIELTVSVTYTVDANGRITLLLTSGTEEGKMYTAEMTFTAQFSEPYPENGGIRTSSPTQRTMEKSTDPDKPDNRIETQTDMTLTERISSVTWTYAGTRAITE